MKTAILPRSDFRAAITAAALVVEKRNRIPILSNVRLRAAPNGDGLVVTGTDLDIELSATIPGAVDAGFNTTLPAHSLRDLEKKAAKGGEFAIDAPDAFIPLPKLEKGWTEEQMEAWNIEAERVKALNAAIQDTDARLDFGGFAARLQTIDVNDYPEMTVNGPFVDFVMSTATLRNALERTTFAISTEETRYYLNGVFMHVVKGALRFVATDGHRLAFHEMPAPDGAGKLHGVIIPRKTISVLAKLLKGKGAPAEVSIRVNTSKAVFTIGNIAVSTKLIDGMFPDYQRVIPSGNGKRARFERDALAAAIDCVSTVSSQRGRAVKLSFEAGACHFTVNNPDEGSTGYTLPCDWDSEPMDIGFNARYVLDILAQCAGDIVTLDLADSGSPALIRPVGAEREATRFVLMPMRV